MDVGRLVTRAARRYGSRIAVEGPEGTRSFAELGDRVERIANGLLGLGLHPGDRVLDLQTNSVSYLETDLAIRAAGLVRVALNYRLHPDDWERIADDCGASALVHHAAFGERTQPLREGLGADRVVTVGGDGGEPGHAYERLVERSPAGPFPSLDADALCGLHYSSGTTGDPKGALRTHRNWLASLVAMTLDVVGRQPHGASAQGGSTRPDVYVHAGPITHTSGLFVLPFLAAGARQLVLPGWDPEELLDAIEQRGATHTALVPTMVARLLAHDGCSPERTAGLRMLGYAGAPMAAEQIRRARERITSNLVQYYGLVEAIPPVTVLNADDHRRGVEGEPDVLASAGRPAFGVELRVVDPDDDQQRPLPAGVVGEVLTRGDHVMRGYWRAERQGSVRDDLGKAVVDGWLRTGDLGRLDEDERLYLVDRKGDMIISGGYNIYPREVEGVIAEVDGVAEVAVIGIDDPDWGQRVTALYTVDDPETDETEIAERITRHCRERMASYKKPKELRRVDGFPLNATGKVAKKLLREQWVAR